MLCIMYCIVLCILICIMLCISLTRPSVYVALRNFLIHPSEHMNLITLFSELGAQPNAYLMAVTTHYYPVTISLATCHLACFPVVSVGHASTWEGQACQV